MDKYMKLIKLLILAGVVSGVGYSLFGEIVPLAFLAGISTGYIIYACARVYRWVFN